MTLRSAAAAIACAFVVLSGARAADEVPASNPPSPFDAQQERAIREIVRDYLVTHPEVIVDAIEVLRERQRAQELENTRQAVTANADALLEDPHTPVVGNPDGDVTIVEFFDYRCGYCKRVFPALMDLLEEDGNIRLVMKEFPILGPESQFAARAALAAREQDRYGDFHARLMEARGELSEDAVMAIAGSVGLDLDRLRDDMTAERIDEALERNFALADRLSIRGTPAFVIGDELVPGAIGLDQLRRMVEEQRERAG